MSLLWRDHPVTHGLELCRSLFWKRSTSGSGLHTPPFGAFAIDRSTPCVERIEAAIDDQKLDNVFEVWSEARAAGG